MDAKDIKINHWYIIDNYRNQKWFKGKVVAVDGDYITVKFYSGGFFRERHILMSKNIIQECSKPELLSNF